jgi:hypothetical protein
MIIFNGQQYESTDAMPPEVRKLYEQMKALLDDTNNDGMPDLLQGATSSQRIMAVTQYVVDGKTYSRLEDLPPHARDRYTAAMSTFDTNQNGIPDILEGGMIGTATTATQPVPPTTAPTSIPTVTIVGDRPSPGTIRMIVIGLIVLVLVAAVAYFFGIAMGGR